MVKITRNVARCPFYHEAYAPAQFKVDLGIKIIQNVAQCPLHHVTDVFAKFEVAMSNGLGGDVFTRSVADDRKHDGLALVRK